MSYLSGSFSPIHLRCEVIDDPSALSVIAGIHTEEVPPPQTDTQAEAGLVSLPQTTTTVHAVIGSVLMKLDRYTQRSSSPDLPAFALSSLRVLRLS